MRGARFRGRGAGKVCALRQRVSVARLRYLAAVAAQDATIADSLGVIRPMVGPGKTAGSATFARALVTRKAIPRNAQSFRADA